MVNHHRISFFGSKTGILFDSGPSIVGATSTIFLNFIKKKEDGSWEKPSKKEGLAIKFSLVDMTFILRVLRGEESVWKTFHSFKERKTHISFERDTETKETIKVKAGDYQKLLNYGEIEVFKALLTHVFEEKVINSTEPKKREDNSEFKKIPEETSEEEAEPFIAETAVLAGVCESETEKALLIAFEGKKEIWVPKSTIHSDYDSKSTGTQKFEIDTWILKKNNFMKEVLS